MKPVQVGKPNPQAQWHGMLLALDAKTPVVPMPVAPPIAAAAAFMAQHEGYTLFHDWCAPSPSLPSPPLHAPDATEHCAPCLPPRACA